MSAYNHYPIIKYADEPEHVQRHMQKYMLSERQIRNMKRGRKGEGLTNTIGMTKTEMKEREITPGGWCGDEEDIDDWKESDKPWAESMKDNDDDSDSDIDVDDPPVRKNNGRWDEGVFKRVITTTITTTEIRLKDWKNNKLIHQQETKKTTETEEVIV